MRAVNFGIDLGTTNSLIAKYDNNKVQVYKNPVGQKETLASVVAYRPERILVGDKAREYLAKDAVNVFGGFKRKMGTDEKYYVVNLDENVTPAELSTLILRELKKFVPPTESMEAAVITIPASFDSMQSNATLKAGLDAGFKEVFLLQEPIAASLAFFNAGSAIEKPNGYWLVYDLGGGTFDVALIKSTDEGLKIADHEGNNFLGGMDFDFAIIDKIIIPEIIRQTGIENFEEEFRVKYGKYEMLYYQVMYYAEEAKKELSQAPATVIEFGAILNNINYDFYITITRESIDKIFTPIVNETIKLLHKVVANNGLTVTDINQIILVGGSTFLPQVREQLTLQTGIPLNYSIDPTTSVAAGAAFYAGNKYFEPAAAAVTSIEEKMVDDLLATVDFSPADVQVEVNYTSSSRDKEEVLLITCHGELDNKYYRISRADGGFDTGFVILKSKKTEFLPLIPGINNLFVLSVYDGDSNEISSLKKEIAIQQGMYNIDGQPLPHDICFEVDDVENKTTKLEVVFARNSLLPQKRTLYREISKTVKKGSKDNIVINILEGDKNSRPSSNLTIGCILIEGKDLESDLIKGSDIEIQIQLTDSRVLKTVVFLVMTQQEFKHVFSVSEKQVNIIRLKEQFVQLENELIATVRQFQHNDNTVWEIKAIALLEELQSVKYNLLKLKEKDKSDEKYVISERVTRISQEYDKLGGNERIATLIEEYLYAKDTLLQVINMADFEKEELMKMYHKIEQAESAFIHSKNVSAIDNKLRQLSDLHWKALSNNIGFLITRFSEYKGYNADGFKDYTAAKPIIKMADTALEKEAYPEFRRHVFNISSLVKTSRANNYTDFKGTGIG
ncbi:MAG: Hsp70 family protein [Ferruginibacter sp.]|nr:Hsp70 family protein [Ferruginibacter sp.]